MKSQRDYQLQLSKVKNLPPLPETSVKIMDALSDPDVSVDELVKVLSLSPSLSARLLGLANSAYFGYPGQICDLRKAIIQVLGLNLVKSLALSIVLNVKLDDANCASFKTGEHWKQALTTAVVAQQLSLKCDDPLLTSAIVYTSGLLLNIGIVAAVFLFPKEMDEIFRRCEKSGRAVDEELQETICITHYQIAYLLLNKWKLPMVYQNVLKEFETLDYRGNEMGLLALLKLSQFISRQITIGKPFVTEDCQIHLERLSLSEEYLNSVVTQTQARKNEIWELAAIISGKY